MTLGVGAGDAGRPRGPLDVFGFLLEVQAHSRQNDGRGLAGAGVGNDDLDGGGAFSDGVLLGGRLHGAAGLGRRERAQMVGGSGLSLKRGINPGRGRRKSHVGGGQGVRPCSSYRSISRGTKTLCRKDKPFEGREDDVQAFYDFKDNHQLPRQHKSSSGPGAILFEVRLFFFCNFISFVPRGGGRFLGTIFLFWRFSGGASADF